MKNKLIAVVKTLSSMILAFVLLCSFSNSVSIKKEVKINDFSLMNVDGKFVSMSDYPKAKGFIIVFTCNHCPFAKLYYKRLNELHEKYAVKGVPLIAISSTDTVTYEEDTFLKMVEKSREENFKFSYLYDSEQKVAKNFSAQKTPHTFVIWKTKSGLKVKYNGAIDDNGAEPDKVKNSYVVNAVDALLAGKVIKVKETKSIGCQIHLRK